MAWLGGLDEGGAARVGGYSRGVQLEMGEKRGKGGIAPCYLDGNNQSQKPKRNNGRGALIGGGDGDGSRLEVPTLGGQK